MKLITLTLLVSLTSCGQSSSSGDGSPAAQVTKSQDPATAPAGVSTSYYVNSLADLITCDSTRHGYLAYVKDSDKFVACLDSGWTEVNVKGQNGVNGTNGTTTTINTVSNTVVNGNTWYDIIDKKYWLIPSVERTATSANAQSACGDSTSAYRLPNEVELYNATSRGLKTQADSLGAPKEAWVQQDQSNAANNGAAGSWQALGDGNFVSEQYVRTGGTIDNLAGFYCIQK